MRVLVFTNLYPGSELPAHGSFVRERLERLRGRLDFEYRVIHPVPLYPPLPGNSVAARHSRLPRTERVGDVDVHYPRYFHVPRYGIGRQRARMTRGARECFAGLVRDFRPDVVDSHYLYPDGCAAVALARENGLGCLVTARGSDATMLPRYPAVRRELREGLPLAARLLAVSADLAVTTADLAGVAKERVVVARNGVDLERFRPGGRAPLRRLVTVAQLIPRKRLDLLLRALAEPEGRALPALDIVGDGPLRRRLEALRGELGLDERVRFAGALDRDGVAEELRAGGVFAFPTRLEGYPNAVLEALASGLPVVATAVNGIPDIAGGGDAAVLLAREAGPAEWARALAGAVARFDREGPSWSAAARARAEELSWDRTLDVLTAVFHEAIATRVHGS